MICGRLPSFIASLPDSVGICTFIIIRMLALLMFGATDRREAGTSEREGAAHRLADETRPGLPASATRHPPKRTYARHATRVKQTSIAPSPYGGSPASPGFHASERCGV